MVEMIDPPSTFAPREEWEAFLAEMRRIKRPSAAVKQAIADAEAHLSGTA